MPIDSVATGRAALAHYKATGKIEFLPHMSQHDFSVWGCVFENDWDGWKQVVIESLRRLIAEEKARCGEYPVKMSAMLAVASTKCYHPSEVDDDDSAKVRKVKQVFGELYPVLFQMWLDAFSDTPEFATALKEHSDKFGPIGLRP